MNIAAFPALSRSTSKASSSHSNPIVNQGISLNKSRHMATIMQENVDPNVIRMIPASNIPTESVTTPTLGDPLDMSIDPRGQPDPTTFQGLIPTSPVDSVAGVPKQFLRDNRPDVVVFVEPRICGKRADSVISALSFPYSYRVEAAGFARGIWVAWYDTVDVTVAITHFQFIHFSIFNKCDKISLYATAVYASPSSSGRKFLWPHLYRLASSIRCSWILFADFNISLDDRKGCAPSSKPSKLFQNLIVDHGLRDMGYTGTSFTWSRGQVVVRLDRYICNSYFDESFPTAVVHHLLRMRSDHRPILLQIGHISRRSKVSPFRYFSGWISHDDFPRMVEDNWSPEESMSDTIRNFTTAADTWNKTVFGYLATKKRIVMAGLRGIQRYLSTRASRFLSALEADLLIELEHLLDQEEMLWKQKSSSDWISQGDRNTSYFHRRAIFHRLRHKNSHIKLTDGTWCDDESILKEQPACFFKNLFADNEHSMGGFPISGSFPEKMWLVKNPTTICSPLVEQMVEGAQLVEMRLELDHSNSFQVPASLPPSNHPKNLKFTSGTGC
ncbi:hypothetical protein V6N13_072391 [Hibiscus sabdariffa]